MAATLDQIAGFLEEGEVKHRLDLEKNCIRTGFGTECYRNADGDNGVQLVIRLDEDGEFIKVFAPSAYSYSEGPHKFALFQTLLQISWRTKMIQFEYDKNDGEVRAIIEFPLEDAQLTRKQLMRCVSGIVQILDNYHDEIVAAIEHGKLPEDEEDLMTEFQEFLRQRKGQRSKPSDGSDLPE